MLCDVCNDKMLYEDSYPSVSDEGVNIRICKKCFDKKIRRLNDVEKKSHIVYHDEIDKSIRM